MEMKKKNHTPTNKFLAHNANIMSCISETKYAESSLRNEEQFQTRDKLCQIKSALNGKRHQLIIITYSE